MPQTTAMENVAKLLNLQLQYLLTAGTHDAPLPDFIHSGCLKRTLTGEVEYDLGPDVFAKDPMETIQDSKFTSKKRKATNTVQKGQRRKVPLTSTLVKHREASKFKDTLP